MGAVGEAGGLFDELEIGALRARNRIVRAATYDGLASAEGAPTPEQIAIYEELSRGGAGTVITGYARVMAGEQANPNMLGAYDDALVPALARLSGAIRAHGAAAVLQIAHGGSAGRPVGADAPRTIGPSAVENPKSGVVPAEASADEIAGVVAAFAEAAARAQAAGFDGVEVHAAHGYLLSQFMNPLLNRRTDAYGGSVAGRARLACEVVAAARARCESFPVLVKIDAPTTADGPAADDALEAALLLVSAGASAIEVSGAWRTMDVAARAGEPFFSAFAARLAREASVPVLITGGVRDAARAEGLVRRARIAAFGLCRPLICEPDLPARWRDDLSYRPRCISCNGCSRSRGARCVLPAR